MKAGMATLSVCGIHHGPHLKVFGNQFKTTQADELAVMLNGE